MTDVYAPCLCGSGKKFKFCCLHALKKWETNTLESTAKFPIHVCKVLKNWHEMGLSPVHVVREIANGTYAYVSYLMDFWCLGLKDVTVKIGMSEYELRHLFKNSGDLQTISYQDARSLILGGIDFAKSIGIPPNALWKGLPSSFVEDNQAYEKKISFGKDGSPLYIPGPYDDENYDFVETLTKVENAKGSNQNLTVENMTITREALSSEAKGYDFDRMSEEDNKLFSKLLVETIQNINAINTQNHIEHLNLFRKKYPNNPTILNQLCVVYNHCGDAEKVYTLIKECYEKFPSYLFAKTAMCNFLLEKNRPDEAIEVLGGYTLTQLYPHRKIFHIDEYKTLSLSLILYFLEVDRIEEAKNEYNCLLKILINFDMDNDPLLLKAKTKISHFKGFKGFKGRIKKLINLIVPPKIEQKLHASGN